MPRASTYRAALAGGLLAALLAGCGAVGDDGAAGSCEGPVDLAPSGTTGGALAPGDCTIEALFPGSGDPTLADQYRITLTANSRLTIRMHSAEVDSFLILLDAFRSLPPIAVGDDTGATLDATIEVPLRAGTYIVLANSFGLETGRYTLVTRAVPAAWLPTPTDGAPSDRHDHTAVWSVAEVIIWGGQGTHATPLNSGGRLDPRTGTWRPMATAGAPSPRWGHTAVWTGTEMIVWGGYARLCCGEAALATGARYDPVSDTWTPTAAAGAPSARGRHSAVWTGSEMIVWGGEGAFGLLGTGAAYDPSADTWSAVSASDAPPPTHCHVSLWTGSEMIVWGGQTDRHLGCGLFSTNTGARYDPAGDTWSPMAPGPSIPPESGAAAVWSGREVLVWSGQGARYDPGADAWTPIAEIGAPSSRTWHTLTWTGSAMVVWGGRWAGASGAGGIYDPSADPAP
jgi:hypothetical protein